MWPASSDRILARSLSCICFVNIARCTILSKGGSACQTSGCYFGTCGIEDEDVVLKQKDAKEAKNLVGLFATTDTIISLHWTPECWTIADRFQFE
jgi:hypothetical protein